SEHYSSSTGVPTNIYKVDLKLLKKINNAYESDGRFSEKGHETHGLYRAAIKAYYRYRLSHPVTPSVQNSKPSTKAIKRKKVKRKSFIQRIIGFLKSLFQRKQLYKSPSDLIIGTKKQVSKHLIAFIDDWEREVHENYLVDNPNC